MRTLLLPIFCFILLISCRENPSESPSGTEATSLTTLKYARGFSINKNVNGVTEVYVHSPWPEAKTSFRYALVPDTLLARITLPRDGYDAIITTPVRSLIVTSTTHIPALESLGAEESLVGFPGLDLISSMKTRSRIRDGQVREIGTNQQLNTEQVIALQPDLLIGFGISGIPEQYNSIEKAGIPVVYNGDWIEASPLGKAEWIKFFGLLLQKEERATELFNDVESNYLQAKLLAEKSKTKPSILSGAVYRDTWYAPGGNSWAAQLINDAHATYIWSDSEEKGSLALSMESVLDKAVNAEFWISPSQYTSYDEMVRANPHYENFRAFQEKHIIGYADSKGPTGGLLYFELGPGRPDLILKDMIYHLHPGLLTDYQPYFFKPLE